ncbi:class I SAM-dependent methyltransferase [Cohaesibacter celericrescens]|jgi:SAM-dependent methyltransferase|uniref:Class I SAM-dependent methyltransferase n=1 Tax=Cohaesibacter celericrescens TaxID=2067669 RepID=A0A2N5XR87_9HYPH|nr:class I SAM-dependent methyltransferase [Cohaesibacter celericrescens]PLW77023.1 class I SAM-dependent methyltransferase [Cohaesibacter celericrescens]
MPPIDDIRDGRSHRERIDFFRAVYHHADGDQKKIPWATEGAKPEVLDWLAANPTPAGARALDVACGLGENAEALAQAGYETVAFDVSDKAIDWAKKRYPNSSVDYHQADLFDLPLDWGRFDLVHECYTLQSLPDELRTNAFDAIARLVAPGGTLLVYARVRPDGSEWEHAPWPVMLGEFDAFIHAGLDLISDSHFDSNGRNGMIPHAFLVYKRPI